MTLDESRLLDDLKRIGVWDMKGGSFEVHMDTEGKVVKIDVHRHFRINPKVIPN